MSVSQEVRWRPLINDHFMLRFSLEMMSFVLGMTRMEISLRMHESPITVNF